MDRQIDPARNFAEAADRLKAHRIETEGQVVRLEALLGQFEETPSGLKEAALAFGGAFAALAHSFADERF